MAKEVSTRENILDAAFTAFMKNGYEETSVRLILDESKATTGSFYHFFPSKEALFEAVVEQYLQGYASHVEAIAKDTSLSAWERFDKLLCQIESASKDYFSALQGNKLHWSVQCALHDKTMQALLPSIRHMVEAAIDSGSVTSRLNVDTQTLSVILLRGVEGMLHTRPMEQMDEGQLALARKNIKEYVALILDSSKGEGGQASD